MKDRQLDKNSPVPLYYQLKNILMKEIRSGEYPPGSQIPTENEIAAMFQISRTTVRQTIADLVNEGKLHRIKAKGTFVAEQTNDRKVVSWAESFDEKVLKSGRTPSHRLLAFDKRPMPEAAVAALNFDGPRDAVHLLRLRCINNEPVMTLETYLDYEQCAYLLDNGKEAEAKALYTELSNRQETKIYRITRFFSAAGAGDEDMAHLRVERGEPLLVIKATSYNAANIPVEYTELRCRGAFSQCEIEQLNEDGFERDF